MNKISFAIALHFHQPIGNFEHIFERACQLCYRPFFEVLARYPNIPASFHLSGCLLDYLSQRQPGLLKLIKDMVERQQIELLGGAYYEPILVSIPERDIKGQIRMMSEYITEHFGFPPTGMWIAERVWDEKLVKPIYDAGICYTILDDSHLLRCGINKENMYGYFLSAQGRKKIAIFPSDKTLRYTIPFKLPQETIDYFKSKAENKENLFFFYGDDGEKFGEWPGTHKWVFEEKWLEIFFNLLLQNSHWIKLVKLGEYLKNNPPLGKVHIGSSSYDEMMEWTDGSWLNFLKKYPESHQMHQRMLYVSNKVERLAKKGAKGDSEKLNQAKRELYKGQCNCAYWHGVFGGLYLFHLRNAIFNHLITADNIADGLLHQGEHTWLKIEHLGTRKKNTALLMTNRDFSLWIEAKEGGVIKEWDYRPMAFNLVNTLSRRQEAYHQKILNAISVKNDDNTVRTIHDDFRTVTPQLAEKLTYDKFGRYCLRNYFVHADLKMEDLINCAYAELGDFANGPYSVRIKNKTLTLSRQAQVQAKMLKLSKQVQLKSDKEIEILYHIERSDASLDNVLLGIEFNLTMPQLNATRYHYFCNTQSLGGLNTKGEVSAAASFGISDAHNEFGLKLVLAKQPQDVWYFPVETVSRSERAYELNYQCSCIFGRWKLDFNKNKKWDLQINLAMV